MIYCWIQSAPSRIKSLRPANSPPSRSLQGGEGEGSPPLVVGDLRFRGTEAKWSWGGTEAVVPSTRPEARGLGGLLYVNAVLAQLNIL